MVSGVRASLSVPLTTYDAAKMEGMTERMIGEMIERVREANGDKNMLREGVRGGLLKRQRKREVANRETEKKDINRETEREEANKNTEGQRKRREANRGTTKKRKN